MEYKTLVDIIEGRKTDATKGIFFIKDNGEEIFCAYSKLYGNALRVLNNLQKAGLEPEDELVFQIYDHEQFLYIFWACILGRIIPVPLTYAMKDDAREKLFKVWKILKRPKLAIDRDALKQFMPGYAARIQTIQADIVYADDLCRLGENGVMVPSHPDQIAFIQFSSGSTGDPKGVVLTHANLVANTKSVIDSVKFDSSETHLSWMPLTHDLGLIGLHIMPMSIGSMQYNMTPVQFIFNPMSWLQRASQHRASVLSAPNFGYRYLLSHYQAEQAADWDLSCVRLIYNGAEPISTEICDAFLEKMSRHGMQSSCMFTVYGMAEATLAITFPEVARDYRYVTLARDGMTFGEPVRLVNGNDPSGIKVVNVGRAFAGSPVRIVDNQGQPMGEHVIGHIQVRGPNVTVGYYNNPAKTREMISADGWLATEDLGFLSDGELYVTGRAKDIIFVNGTNYYSHDLEAFTEKIDGVGFGRAAAIGVRNAANSEDDIVICIKYKESALSAFLDTADHVKATISAKTGLKVRHVIPIQRLPRTTSGKPQRYKLRAAFRDGQYDDVIKALARLAAQRQAVHLPPQSATAQRIADIWSRVLAAEVKTIGADTTFLELGGDSLNAIEIAVAIERELNLPVTVSDVFAYQALQPLADHMDRQAQNRLSDMTPALNSADHHQKIVAAPQNKHLAFPLTEVQQAYWLGRSDLFEMGNVSTHVYWEMDIDHLDLERLNGAVQKTIARHDMLKAVIQPNGTQRILESVPAYTIDVEDLHQDPAWEERLGEIRARLSHEVLPADTWPLFRIKASRLDRQRTRLHLSIDLLCIDGWSIRIMLDDMAAFYSDPDWMPEPLQINFRDYMVAYTQSCVTTRYQFSQKYWDKRLVHLPPAPELPVAPTSKALTHPRFSRLENKLDAPAWQRLKQLAIQHGLTPSAVLLTLFAEVLAKWSKKKKFTINVTLFNRPDLHAQINAIIGDFTSSILLEVDCTPPSPLAQRARRVLQQLASDLEHRQISGVSVIRAMARKQGKAPNALMPIVFTSMLGYGVGEGSFTRLSEMGQTVYAISQTPQVWLDHQIYEEKGELHYNWDYVPARFPADVIEQMFAVYRQALDAFIQSDRGREPEPVQLPGHHLVARKTANATTAPVSGERLHTLFLQQARKHPDATALISHDTTLTYQALLERCRKVGRYLRHRSVTCNSFVAVAMEKSWEQVVSVLGILFSGAAYLPLDPTLPEERLHQLLASAQAPLVLTKGAGLTAASLPENTTCLDLATILAAPEDPADLSEAIDFKPVQGIKDLAYMIFTSGSTGVPKGVMIDHRGAVNTILDINDRFTIGTTDRVLALSHLNFDLSVYDIFGTLAAGATIVLPHPDKLKDPEHWAQLVQTHQVNVWNSVPALMELLAQYAQAHAPDALAPLGCVMLSGDWIPVDLPSRIKRLARNAKVFSLGGATEASIWSICYPIEDVPAGMTSIPYGKPMRNQTFYVLDEQLDDCPDWVPGELYIGGIGLALGYWKDEAKTEAHFFHHPVSGERLYRTGDWGRYLPDGNIEFLGRDDLQVKVNGHRIELGEIEAILERHPGVLKAVAEVAGPSKNLLVAYVVLNSEAFGPSIENHTTVLPATDPVIMELKGYLEKKIPAYMIPNTYFQLDRIPLTANGKIDRNILRGRCAGLEKKTEFIAPANDTQRALAAIWRDLLHLEKVGLEDNFFDLGGDSLLAIQLHVHLRKQFKKEIPMALMYKHTTIASMADYLDQKDQALQQTEKQTLEHAVAQHQAGLDRRTQSRQLRRRQIHHA